MIVRDLFFQFLIIVILQFCKDESMKAVLQEICGLQKDRAICGCIFMKQNSSWNKSTLINLKRIKFH